MTEKKVRMRTNRDFSKKLSQKIEEQKRKNQMSSSHIWILFYSISTMSSRFWKKPKSFNKKSQTVTMTI